MKPAPVDQGMGLVLVKDFPVNISECHAEDRDRTVLRRQPGNGGIA
ncbi:hypothetical protein [Pseudarthrobacter sp. NPDC080039]